jgi:hypothetical protein
MTGMVQPDVGPPAKYKENSVDDPVSIISILRGTLSFFLSSSCLPYRFCEMFPTSISFLSFLVISLCRAALCPVGFLFFFFFGPTLGYLSRHWISLLSTCFSIAILELVQPEQHCQYLGQKTAANSGCRHW